MKLHWETEHNHSFFNLCVCHPFFQTVCPCAFGHLLSCTGRVLRLPCHRQSSVTSAISFHLHVRPLSDSLVGSRAMRKRNGPRRQSTHLSRNSRSRKVHSKILSGLWAILEHQANVWHCLAHSMADCKSLTVKDFHMLYTVESGDGPTCRVTMNWRRWSPASIRIRLNRRRSASIPITISVLKVQVWWSLLWTASESLRTASEIFLKFSEPFELILRAFEFPLGAFESLREALNPLWKVL